MIDISVRKELVFYNDWVLDCFAEGVAPAMSQVWQGKDIPAVVHIVRTLFRVQLCL